jgi:hypothetical protein
MSTDLQNPDLQNLDLGNPDLGKDDGKTLSRKTDIQNY